MSGSVKSSPLVRSSGRWDGPEHAGEQLSSQPPPPHPVHAALLMTGVQFGDAGCLDHDSSGSCCTRLRRRGIRLIMFVLIFLTGLALQTAFDATLTFLLPTHQALCLLIKWTIVVLLIVCLAIVASYLHSAQASVVAENRAEYEDEENPKPLSKRKRPVVAHSSGGSVSESVTAKRSYRRGR